MNKNKKGGFLNACGRYFLKKNKLPLIGIAAATLFLINKSKESGNKTEYKDI
jgi:hypothetical protein